MPFSLMFFTFPLSLHSSFSSVSLPLFVFISATSSSESQSGSKWIPPDRTNQPAKVLFFIISCLLVCSVSQNTLNIEAQKKRDFIFFSAITAKLRFFDLLIFLAIRARCNTCSRQEGEQRLDFPHLIHMLCMYIHVDLAAIEESTFNAS